MDWQRCITPGILLKQDLTGESGILLPVNLASCHELGLPGLTPEKDASIKGSV
jgi:hypothetical protein